MPSRRVPTCHHLFADTHRCGSPALRGEDFCYYHHPDRKPVANPYARRARRGFQITLPSDRPSLQKALNETIQRIASNRIDTRRAGLLLHTLQMAARHL